MGGMHGFGPTWLIGEIAALPGDTVDMAEINEYRGGDARRGGTEARTSRARGVHSNVGKLVLPRGDFLLESTGRLWLVDAATIGAVVAVKLGHDAQAERRFRKTIY